MSQEPTSLQEAIVYFNDPTNCREYLVARRWPDGVACPRCSSTNVLFLEKYNRWHCREGHDAPQFTMKTGTIMEDSPIAIGKWMLAMWQIVNCKNGVSSYEIARAVKVTQKTAWFLDHRIRLALCMGSFEKLSGEVEVDETFIGGLSRNMHKEKRARRISGTGGKDKVPVLGLLKRGGEVRTAVIPNRRKKTLDSLVRHHVAEGSAVYTDALPSYNDLESAYMHQVVDHAIEYVRGRVHTNGLENFWSLLKRGIKGTYVSVEPFHLNRYLDEQMFRYNNRLDMNDGDRFDLAVRQIVGKRLTYKALTGADSLEAHFTSDKPEESVGFDA